MRKLVRSMGLAAVLVGLAASCGGGRSEPQTPGTGKGGPGDKEQVVAAAQKGFNDALESMVAHDKANGGAGDWNEATCSQVAKSFLDASSAQKAQTKKDLPEAVYNAGLAWQRCGKDAEAKKYFQQSLDLDSKFHRARTQLALYDYREKGEAAMESAISQLRQAVTDAQFQNVEALVSLANLQMKRLSTAPDQDGANDLERAKKNLQRALAIDDGYQPAFNQLALYYLELARLKAGRASKPGTKARVTVASSKSKRADVQQLELAALVASQAIRKNPNYAPIHNTAGLIQIELQNINSAVQSFQTAIKLDPNFFEAQMNFAAINLSFRGFEEAEKAYRKAVEQRPNDFDAHLGLALAIRGQINDSNFDDFVKKAQASLDTCKKLAPERAEPYYNEAILTQEFKAKSGDSNAVPMLKAAAGIYEQFIQKAGGAPEYADAVKRAKERIEDITKTVKFIEEGVKQRDLEEKMREEEEKRQAAEAADGGAPAGEGEKKPEEKKPEEKK